METIDENHGKIDAMKHRIYENHGNIDENMHKSMNIIENRWKRWENRWKPWKNRLMHWKNRWNHGKTNEQCKWETAPKIACVSSSKM